MLLLQIWTSVDLYINAQIASSLPVLYNILLFLISAFYLCRRRHRRRQLIPSLFLALLHPVYYEAQSLCYRHHGAS